MQNNNLLKKALLALLLCVALPYVNAQVHVGDILCEGNLIYPPSIYPSSGATAMGVVFYVDQTGQHGWAVALQYTGGYTWGCARTDTPLPNYENKRQAIYDLDGYENTRIVREHSTDHPAFYAVDFENGWYVPTFGQFNYLYGNILEVNTSLEKVGGDRFTGGWEIWTSTEYSWQNVWFWTSSGDFDNWGYDYSGNKGLSRTVRAVRNF
jgi:hypothetical protein